MSRKLIRACPAGRRDLLSFNDNILYRDALFLSLDLFVLLIVLSNHKVSILVAAIKQLRNGQQQQNHRPIPG